MPDHPIEPFYEAFVALYGFLARDPRPARTLLDAWCRITGTDYGATLADLETYMERARSNDMIERELLEAWS